MRRTVRPQPDARKADLVSRLHRLRDMAPSNGATAVQALRTWQCDIRLVHRLGRLERVRPACIAVASAHRPRLPKLAGGLSIPPAAVPIGREFFEDGAMWADGSPFPECR